MPCAMMCMSMLHAALHSVPCMHTFRWSALSHAPALSMHPHQSQATAQSPRSSLQNVRAQEPGDPHAAVQRTGYTGFGSFMTDQSVEEMISEPESSYRPPRNPFEEDLGSMASTSTPLGLGCRSLFMVDFDQWTCGCDTGSPESDHAPTHPPCTAS
jgi:hypothetical protein